VPPSLEELTDFVLDPFPTEDRQVLDSLLDPMADAVETWLDEGIEQAMAKHNRS
jgi:peptidyl-tRNA hydrolase